MKRILALLLAGLLLLGLAGCGLPFLKTEESAPPEAAAPAEEAAPAESEEPTPALTLSLGTAAEGEEAARLDYALARLRETLPDVAVERVPLPDPEGEQPDLLALTESEITARAAAGLLRDLSGEAKAAALLEGLVPAERERAFTPEGELWALPQHAAETCVFLVNDAVFEEAGLSAPRSLSELPAAAAELAARGETALLLCPDDEQALLALLEAFLWEADSRGLAALYRGETSPYDESFLSAAGALYRLSRADAVVLLSREDCEAQWSAGTVGLRFARESEAADAAPELGARLHMIPCRATVVGEGAGLAVSAASERASLAVDAACLLCAYLAEYDLRLGGGACLAYPHAAGTADEPSAQELAELRAGMVALTCLEPESEPALTATLTEGVWELLRGSMIPEEFSELAAMALER